MIIETRRIEELTNDPENARSHDEANIEAIKKSLERFGQQKNIVIDKEGVIYAGNGTVEAARQLGWEELTVSVSDLTGYEMAAYAIADNRTAELAEWDSKELEETLLKLDEESLLEFTGFDETDIMELLSTKSDDEEAGKPDGVEQGSLARDFIAPPFSILRSDQPYWAKRAAEWNRLGFDGAGRKDDLAYGDSVRQAADYDKKARIEKKLGREVTWNEFDAANLSTSKLTGTSVFDPVLCEIAYVWHTPKGAKVLDPFAGGPQRGAIAALKERDYVGVDLRPEQVEANKIWAAGCGLDASRAEWLLGDSTKIDSIVEKGDGFDFVFSCPPYADLEKYSDDPRDLSNMEYDRFLAAYNKIIAKSVAMLKDNRFAVWVVGGVRAPSGVERGFVRHSIEAFEAAGMKLYNEIILSNSNGSAPLRARRSFSAGRKVCRIHQHVLVFVKGDWKKAAEYAGPVEVDAISFKDDDGRDETTRAASEAGRKKEEASS